MDPSGRVDIPDDPNLASGPGLAGEQALMDAFPHLPDNLSRDPRDRDQPLVPPSSSSSQSEADSTDNRHGGAPKRVLSFSNPKPGHFSFQRRRPDINFLQQILSDL